MFQTKLIISYLSVINFQSKHFHWLLPPFLEVTSKCERGSLPWKELSTEGLSSVICWVFEGDDFVHFFPLYLTNSNGAMESFRVLRNRVLITTRWLFGSQWFNKLRSSFWFQLTFFQAPSLCTAANAQDWGMWYNGACRLEIWSGKHIVIYRVAMQLGGRPSPLCVSQTVCLWLISMLPGRRK